MRKKALAHLFKNAHLFGKENNNSSNKPWCEGKSITPMSKTNRLVIFCSIIIGILLSFGCQPQVEESPTAIATRTRSATVIPTATASITVPKFACADKLGCIDIGPNEPIHLAYALAMTGNSANLGLDVKYGAELAIDDASTQILGHAIKFDGQDSGCASEGGQAAATKLAADKTIVAVIGTSCASEARTAMPILTQAGLTMISPSTVAPDLTDPTKRIPGFFRTAYNDKTQSSVAAEFAYKQLKLGKAAIINDGTAYTQAMANEFASSFKKFGGNIVAQEAIKVGDKDTRAVLTRIAATKPDVLYYPVFETEGSVICFQARDTPGLEKVVMMGSDGIVSPDFLKTCGKNAVGMFWSIPNLNFAGNYSVLVDKYLKKYNVKQTQSVFHAQSYDAVNIVLAALVKPSVVIKDADGTLHVQKQALRDAIAATKNFKGISGNLTCDANGDCADPRISIYRFSADDLAKLNISTTPVWSPGGPDYKP